MSYVAEMLADARRSLNDLASEAVAGKQRKKPARQATTVLALVKRVDAALDYLELVEAKADARRTSIADGGACGHSACRQHWIDTGLTACVATAGQ